MSIGPRLALAAVVSPLAIVPTVIAAYLVLNFKEFLLIIFQQTDPARFFEGLVETTMMLSIFGIMFGWLLTFMVGIPVYALLRYFGMAEPIPCALLGAIFGLLFGSMILPEVDYAFMIMACGAAVAAAFAGIADGHPEPPPAFAAGEWY